MSAMRYKRMTLRLKDASPTKRVVCVREQQRADAGWNLRDGAAREIRASEANVCLCVIIIIMDRVNSLPPVCGCSGTVKVVQRRKLAK